MSLIFPLRTYNDQGEVVGVFGPVWVTIQVDVTIDLMGHKVIVERDSLYLPLTDPRNKLPSSVKRVNDLLIRHNGVGFDVDLIIHQIYTYLAIPINSPQPNDSLP